MAKYHRVARRSADSVRADGKGPTSVDLIDYLSAIRRRWFLPVLLVLVAVVAVVVTTPDSPGPSPTPDLRFTAAHILVSDGSGSGGGANLDRTAFLVTVGDIPRRVADRLGDGDDAAELASAVRTTAEPGLGTLQIIATADDPDRAELLADTFAEETVAFFEEQSRAAYEAALARADEAIEQQEERVRSLDAQLRVTRESTADYEIIQAQRDSAVNQYRAAFEQFQSIAADGPPSSGLQTLQDATAVVQRAETGLRPPESRTGRLAVGVGAALVLGVALALVVDRLDTRLHARHDFEEVYGVPVLTEVPRLRRNRAASILTDGADPASVEAHRALRTQLLLLMEQRAEAGTAGGQVVVVTSAVAKEGKTTTVANLAASFAETGRSVLVLGADLHHRDIGTVLGASTDGAAEDSPGLVEVLAGDAQLASCLRETAVKGVRLLSGGATSTPHRGVLDGATRLFAEAARLADITIVDTAPMLLSSDAVEAAVRGDLVVVVGRSGRTPRGAAVRTAGLLSALTDPVGIVLIGAPSPSVGRYGAYYAQSPRADARSEPVPPSGVNGYAVREVEVATPARFDRAPGFVLRHDGPQAVLDLPGGGVAHPLAPAELVVWRELVVPLTKDELRLAVEGRHADADPDAALERLLGLGAVRRQQ